MRRLHVTVPELTEKAYYIFSDAEQLSADYLQSYMQEISGGKMTLTQIDTIDSDYGSGFLVYRVDTTN